MAAMLKAIHAQDDRPTALDKVQAVIEMSEALNLAKAAGMLGADVSEVPS